MKKALFFVNSLAGGGAERVCLNLAGQLYEAGISSDFVTVYDTKADYELPEYVQILSLGIADQGDFSDTFFKVVSQVHRVNAFISGKEYVLITAHLPTSHFLASLTRAGRKTLYVMHVTQHLTDRDHSLGYMWGFRLFYKGKKIVAVSKGLEEELNQEYGIPKKRTATIYNPCGAAFLKYRPGQTALHGRPYILFMGRLEEQKSPLSALELYEKGAFYKEYDLIYLGKGSLEFELKKKIAEYQLEDRVFLEGFQKNPGEWLAGASLLLSCSRQEGLPMNLVEALICKTPVVAADCPHGPKEILTGELKRYLIDPEKKFYESIDVIASALKAYPEITESYYEKFDDTWIMQTYLTVWRKAFGI